ARMPSARTDSRRENAVSKKWCLEGTSWLRDCMASTGEERAVRARGWPSRRRCHVLGSATRGSPKHNVVPGAGHTARLALPKQNQHAAGPTEAEPARGWPYRDAGPTRLALPKQNPHAD